VVATSSVTAALRDRRSESGIGRWSEQFLLPYQFTEYVDLTGTPLSLDVGPTLAETMETLPRRFPQPDVLAALRHHFLLLGGFPDAALQRGVAPLGDPVERGLLLENLAACSLHALAQHTGTRLHYWRSGEHKVDLVLDHPTRPMAFEIASSARHGLTGLYALANCFPRFAGRCYLVAADAPLHTPPGAAGEVGITSLDHFLSAVGRQTEAALADRLTV